MRKNVLGSELFGTSVVKSEEYVLLAKTMATNGSSVQEIKKDIEFLDDCLTMSRMVSVIGRAKTLTHTKNGNMRKKTALTDFINSRLDQMVS